ncbi:MAG: RICIN domain-containing protein, partial [Rhodospirillales bacterium]
MKSVNRFKKAKYHKQLGCKSGQFHDPRKGGECWSCPKSHPYRSTKAVTSGGACHNGTSSTYRSVRIINVSGEKIRFLIQANPGCGRVYKGRKGDPGHSFVCYQAALNDGDQKTYLPSAWIDVARSAQQIGPAVLGAALSFGAGVMTGGGPLAAAATSVSYDILKKGIAKGISMNDSAAPEGIMLLRVFPKGKVKVGYNQVRCIVPQGTSTIYIGKSNSRKGKTQRFTCSLIPQGVLFNGIALNRASAKNNRLCLDLDTKRKKANLKNCVRKGKGKSKTWHRNQLVYIYGGNENGGAIRFTRHRRNYCLEATGKNDIRAARCTKRGEARGNKQRWRVTENGNIVNAHWSKAAKKPVCLTTDRFQVKKGAKLSVWPCDETGQNPQAVRWHPVTPSGKYGLQLEGGGSLRHKGQKVRPIHVRNLSGEPVDI